MVMRGKVWAKEMLSGAVSAILSAIPAGHVRLARPNPARPLAADNLIS